MRRAQRLGVEPGGQILLHGQRKGSVMSNETVQRSNWTNGCIALINADMDGTLYHLGRQLKFAHKYFEE